MLLSRYFLLFSIFAIITIPSYAYGALDESVIDLTWQTTGEAGALTIDADLDGIADGLYTFDSTSGTITFTKVIGNGASSAVITLPAGTVHEWSVWGDKLYIMTGSGSGVTCTSVANEVNFTTGVTTPSLLTQSNVVSTSPANLLETRAYIYNNNLTIASHCQASATHRGLIDNPTDGILYDTGNVSGTYYGIVGQTFFGVRISSGAAPNAIWFIDNSTIDSNVSIINYDYQWNNCRVTTGLVCNVNVNSVLTTSQVLTLAAADLPSSVYHPPSLKTYVGSIDITLPAGLPPQATTDAQFLIQDHTKHSLIATMFPRITGLSSSSSHVVTQLFDDGTNKYILNPESGAYKYANIDDLWIQNRGYQSIALEDSTTVNQWGSTYTGLGAKDQNLVIVAPDLTYTITNTIGGTVPSGYKAQATNNVDRVITPTHTDVEDTRIFYDRPTTSLTALALTVNNSPSSAAISIRDTITTNGEANLFGEGYLTADRSYNVDLPSNKCVKIYLRDLNLLTAWEYLGDLCASGVMPKSIPYLSNLAFTFWSLPWGVDSKYNQETATLETLVRNDNPYTYYVDIYDNTDTLIESNLYNVPAGGLDLQTYNTTGYNNPSRVVYLDAGSNSTIYQTTIGFPSYLSGVSSAWGSIFSIDGFNILYMLPIIFAAMFTRNSVGIGSGLTVAMVAMLVWFGVITVPEPVIYIMIFVAILGMIVYKIRY